MILLFLHAHIPSIKTTTLDCNCHYISRNSHDIIEHDSKLPIRVPFCCFLCTVCSNVSDSLMLAIRVLFCCFLCTVCSIVSDSLMLSIRVLLVSQWFQTLLYVFHTNYNLLFAWIGRRVNSVHTSVLQVQQLHTADIPSEAYLLPIPKEHELCSLPK